MDTNPFDLLARRAALGALGAAGLASLAGFIGAGAKARHTKAGDGKGRCQKQAKNWTTFFTDRCDDDPVCLDVGACGAKALARCDFRDFVDCIV